MTGIVARQRKDVKMQELTRENAARLSEQAAALAMQEFKRPVCVAVCDALGFLSAFVRMDGSPVRSIDISQGKAYSAVRMGTSTQALLARIQREGIAIGYFCDPRLTALPGGSVLKDVSGSIIGGIGVSGLTSEQDQVVTDRIAEQFLSAVTA
ncbi:MAG: heme-binding protein [Betaproteobacteria bacterium]